MIFDDYIELYHWTKLQKFLNINLTIDTNPISTPIDESIFEVKKKFLLKIFFLIWGHNILIYIYSLKKGELVTLEFKLFS